MATTDWIGGSGDWGDGSNWSAGVPNDDTVHATLGGTSVYTAAIGANASFNVGSLDINNANAVLSLNSDLTAAGAIDLEAGTLAVGARGVLNGSSSGASFVNHGTISAETAGGVFAVDGMAFTNAATFDIGNSNTAYIEGPFTNTGTVNIASGARLFFQGGETTGDLGNIVNGGLVVLYYGTLDNSNAVLKLGSGNTLGSVQLNGTIKGGTIIDSGDGLIPMAGTLDGVKYEGTLTVDSGSLGIEDGLSFTGVTGKGAGAMVIDHDTGVYFEGTQTVNNATVTLGNASATGGLDSTSNGSAATLTLGPALTIIVKGAGSGIGGDGTIVNQGRIIAETTGTAFIPNGVAYLTPSAITNTGTIIVANGEGDVFQVVAPLTNSGAAEVISGIFDLRSTVAGTGSIQIDRSGVLLVEQAMGAGQRVVFYKTGGALELDSSSTFQASIAGFSSGHFLDLRDIAFGSGTTVSFAANSTGGTLIVSDGSHSASLKLVGNFSGGTFNDKADDIGGTIVFFTDAATAAVRNRLEQFNSAVAIHSADKASFAAVHGPMPDEAAARSILAAAHH